MLFHNWQKHGTPPGPPYNAASPNLKALLSYALKRFGGTNLGIYNVRPATGLTVWSAHAYGAANDWGYGTNRQAALDYIDFLIEHHVVLGVQMIVDEGYDRAWKCWRDELGGPGWKSSAINGGSWLHIETTPDKWADSTPITDRLPIVAPPAPTPDPVPPAPTPEEDDMLRYIQPEGDAAVFLLDGLECSWLAGVTVAAISAAQPPLVAPGVTPVKRQALKGLVLVGAAPDAAAYAGAGPSQPGRTVPSDFAGHRPNG